MDQSSIESAFYFLVDDGSYDDIKNVEGIATTLSATFQSTPIPFIATDFSVGSNFTDFYLPSWSILRSPLPQELNLLAFYHYYPKTKNDKKLTAIAVQFEHLYYQGDVTNATIKFKKTKIEVMREMSLSFATSLENVGRRMIWKNEPAAKNTSSTVESCMPSIEDSGAINFAIKPKRFCSFLVYLNGNN